MATDLSMSQSSPEAVIIVRAVTAIIGTVVGLTFLFGFGNVLNLALRLGMPVCGAGPALVCGQLDPAAGPLREFAYGLRELRRYAGSPTYQALASRVHCSKSAPAGRGGKLGRAAVVAHHVGLCAGVRRKRASHSWTALHDPLLEQFAAAVATQWANEAERRGLNHLPPPH